MKRKIYLFLAIMLFLSQSEIAFAQRTYEVPEQYREKPTETKAAAIRRAAPEMPNRADKSGFCCMVFEVSEKGKPDNISATQCSEKLFERNAIKTVKKWRFEPANINGTPIRALNHYATITFLKGSSRGRFIADENNIMIDRSGQRKSTFDEVCAPHNKLWGL